MGQTRLSVRVFSDFTKFGIVILVLLTALAGYGLSYSVEKDFHLLHLLSFLVGLGLFSGGSLALNQAQEWKLDTSMPRTQKRPIPAGVISPTLGFVLAVSLMVVGLAILFAVNSLVVILCLLTALFYNGFYTLYWKRTLIFGAVPGAIPGAMPVVIGFAANSSEIFSSECLYLFLIMFLWQMPHFWALAIKYSSDYKAGGVPVLPVSLGVKKTLFHTGLYTFVYVMVALISPFFVPAKYVYLVLVLPFSLKVIWEFYKFYRANGEKRWLPFFLWTNFSMLVFLVAPVVDKWSEFLSGI